MTLENEEAPKAEDFSIPPTNMGIYDINKIKCRLINNLNNDGKTNKDLNNGIL